MSIIRRVVKISIFPSDWVGTFTSDILLKDSENNLLITASGEAIYCKES